MQTTSHLSGNQQQRITIFFQFNEGTYFVNYLYSSVNIYLSIEMYGIRHYNYFYVEQYNSLANYNSLYNHSPIVLL